MREKEIRLIPPVNGSQSRAQKKKEKDTHVRNQRKSNRKDLNSGQRTTTKAKHEDI